jgi:hypothetical protein
VWPQANFNWWRCWESCGGISLGIAYGLAYYLVNRPSCSEEAAKLEVRRPRDLNLERFGGYFGLLLGLGLSIKNGLKGWVNIYIGNEEHWNHILWMIVGSAMLLCLASLVAWIRLRPLPRDFRGDLFPRAYRLAWLVLITQNVIAQLVTGPHSNWNETAFSIYYLLLFIISAVILHHFHHMKSP